eukprot:gene5122-biopygen4570
MRLLSLSAFAEHPAMCLAHQRAAAQRPGGVSCAPITLPARAPLGASRDRDRRGQTDPASKSPGNPPQPIAPATVLRCVKGDARNSNARSQYPAGTPAPAAARPGACTSTSRHGLAMDAMAITRHNEGGGLPSLL